jgi:ADP-ribosylglycohydrolase
MIGAIAGDIIGSVYEKRPLKTTDFPLFVKHSRFTDDTVLTVAVADCLLNRKDFRRTFQAYGRKYPKKYYGARFLNWIFEENPQPYNSFGNGSAMRVSPIGYFFYSLEEVLHHAEMSASVTHNHIEGIKGAQAVACAIFLANNGKSKTEIKDYISNRFGYNLDRTIIGIRESYQFDVSCQGSVPESIIAFLDSLDFEDAIRNAISLGGDSDTMACIAGGIAEAYYKKIPDYIIAETKSRLNEEFLIIIESFERKVNCIY